MEPWKNLADIAQIAESVIVILVAIGGASLYLKRRQRFPRAKLSHSIHHLPLEDGRIFLRVIVTLTNLGEVLIKAKNGVTWIQVITPGDNEFLCSLKADLNGCNISWPMIDEKTISDSVRIEIEPNEEQEFCFEFLLPPDPHMLSIFSHFDNESKKEQNLGWNKTSLYDLRTHPSIQEKSQ